MIPEKWEKGLDAIVNKLTKEETLLDFEYFSKLAKWVADSFGTPNFDYRCFIYEALTFYVSTEEKTKN